MATLSELNIRRDKLLERFESLQKRVTHGDKTVDMGIRLPQAKQPYNIKYLKLVIQPA